MFDGDKPAATLVCPYGRAQIRELAGKLARATPHCVTSLFRRLWTRNWFRLLLGAALSFWTLGFLNFNFRQPYFILGDATFILAQARIFLEGGHFFTSTQLGFPAGQDLFEFPFTDMSERLLLYIGTMASQDAVTGVNFYVVFTIVANSVSGQIAMQQWLRRPSLALIGAWAFATLPFFATRIGGHHFLAAYYPAALAFLLMKRACLVPTQRLAWLARPRDLASLIVIATSGVYFTFFSLLLWSVSGLAMAVRQWSWRRLTPFVALCVACLCFFLALLYVILPAQGIPRRLPAEQPLYSVRLSDLLVVLDVFHLTSRKIAEYVQIRGPALTDFWPGPILSVFAVANILLAYAAKSAERSFETTRALMRTWMLFCLFFASPFGLGLLFNLLITPEIRAQERLGPFFGFAVIALFLLWWEKGAERRLREWVGEHAGKVASIILLGLFVPLNNYISVNHLTRLQQGLRAYETKTHEMASVSALLELVKSHRVKAVAQFPNAVWPEAPPINGSAPYLHLLPYALSPSSDKTAWSYGMTSNRPEFDTLTSALTTSSCNVTHLRALGFDAAMIDMRFYPEDALSRLKDSLLTQGAVLIGEALPRLLYSLPAAAGACTIETGVWHAAREGTENGAIILESWLTAEPWGRWGRGSTHRIRVRLADLHPRALSLSLRLLVMPLANGRAPEIKVRAGGKIIGVITPSAPMQQQEARLLVPEEAVAPDGALLLELEQAGGPISAKIVTPADTRKLGIGLVAFRIDVTDETK